jgi:lipopolysaccharide export system permease protein
MNKKLHKLVFNAYIGPFLLTFFIAMFFLIMQFLWKYIDDLLGKGLDVYILTELMFYASANLVPMALPIAILLSSIMTFGNLAESNEMTAMKSVGLSNLRIMRPLIIFIFAISIGSFFFANYTWPVANLKFRALIADIAHQRPTLSFREKVFNNDIDHFSIRINEKVKNKPDHFKGVRIADHSAPANFNQPLYKKDIFSEEGNIKKTADDKYMILSMKNGVMEEELIRGLDSSDIFPHQSTQFKEAKIRMDLSSLKMQRTNTDLFKDLYEMFNMEQLNFAIDSVEKQNVKILDNFSESHKFAFLIFREPIKNAQNPNDTITFNKHVKIMKADAANPQLQRNTSEDAANTLRNAQTTYNFSLDQIANNNKVISLMKVEWHRKLTLPIACILLFFIGAAMGTIIKKGGIGAPIVAATILFLVYYIISITGEKMAKGGALSPFTGMWLSALILTPVAILLLQQSNSDSKLFDLDTYKRLLGMKKNVNKVTLPSQS